MTFIQRFGLIQYDRTKLPDRLGMCELCPPLNTVFDHCHEHGWIRGEVCSSHNGRMKQIDAGLRPELWEPWMLMHWQRCPDCAASRMCILQDRQELDVEFSQLDALLLMGYGFRRSGS